MALPLLPIMYFQGKDLKENAMRLPAAKESSGRVDIGSDQTLKVLLMGESTMAGVGVEFHKDGFAGSFARELSSISQSNVEWQVFAQSGFNLKQLIKHVLPKVPISDFDLIVIAMGANDAFQLNSPKTWRKNIEKLIDRCQEKFPNTPIGFCNMPPIKLFPAFPATLRLTVGNLVELFGKELIQICTEKNKVYFDSQTIDLNDWLHQLDGDQNTDSFFSDGIHPNKLTYKIWGEEFAKFVVQQIELKP